MLYKRALLSVAELSECGSADTVLYNTDDEEDDDEHVEESNEC